MKKLKTLSILLALIATSMTLYIQGGFTPLPQPKVPDDATIYTQLVQKTLKQTNRLYSNTARSCTTSELNLDVIEYALKATSIISENITRIVVLLNQFPPPTESIRHCKRLNHMRRVANLLKVRNDELFDQLYDDTKFLPLFQANTKQRNNRLG